MRVAWMAGVLLTTGSMGCASMTSRVRERSANEFHCPEDSIEVEDLGSGGYRATGCDETATYVCIDRGVRTVCVREGQASASSSAPASPPVSAAPGHPPKEVLCSEAFNHVYELSNAWIDWHPDREARPIPSREDFLAVCQGLTMQQQACLVMPWGRTHHASCGPTLDTLPAPTRDQLDGLFLAPPR